MQTITVNDSFQKNYVYTISEPMGKNFAEDFHPQLTPQEMLELGVFWGVYFNDYPEEFEIDVRENIFEFITHPVTIPKIGDAESLNAGIAAGIIVAQLTR